MIVKSIFTDPLAALNEAEYIADLKSGPAYILRLATGEYVVQRNKKNFDRRVVCVVSSSGRRRPRIKKIRAGV